MNNGDAKIDIKVLYIILLLMFLSTTAIVGGGYFFVKFTKPQEKIVEENKIKEQNQIKASHLSVVSEYSGEVEYRSNDKWSSISNKIRFNEKYNIRTSENSTVTIRFPSDNKIKLYSLSECLINSPELTNPNDEKQLIELKKGEITTTFAQNNKEIIQIQVSDLTITGTSGVFKIIYDAEKKKGEIIVKKGAFDVQPTNSASETIQLTGFYKVTFENGKLDSRCQTSLLNYEWN